MSPRLTSILLATSVALTPAAATLPTNIFHDNTTTVTNSDSESDPEDLPRWRVGFEERPTSRLTTPEKSFGVGLYLYLYLSRSNYYTIVNGGAGTAAAIYCLPLGAANILASGACTAMMAGVAGYLQDRGVPGRNQCGELKIYWGVFLPAGYKIINKPCSRL